MKNGLFFSTGGIHLATLMGMFIGLKDSVQHVDYYGGISAGAFLSALCATYNIEELETIIKEHAHDKLLQNRHKYFNTIISTLCNKSILDDSNLEHLIHELLGNREVQKDLFIGVTNGDTMTYEVKHFEKGKVYESLPAYVHGSMSMPLFLPGVKYKTQTLIDGGMFHTLPVEAIDQCIDKVVKDNEKEFTITILSAKRFDAKMKPLKTNNFQIPYKAIRMLYSHGYTTMHNDHIILNKAISSAEEHGLGIHLNFFSIPDDKISYYDQHIKMRDYGHVEKNMVNILVELGKKIVHNALYNKLKF
jgi:predicted patatin/cPLA2 family phospholipase